MAELLASIGSALKHLTVPVLLGIFVAASVLLLLPVYVAGALGLQSFRDGNRTYISLALIISGSLLVGRWLVVAWDVVRPRQRPLVITPEARVNALWWSQGSTGDRPVRQVVGDFHLTNTTDEAMHLMDAVLRPRRLSLFPGRAFKGDTFVTRAMPPRSIASTRVHFMIVGKEKPQPGPLVADLALVDQFGVHHWLRGLVFKDTQQPMEDQ